jgi:hypothetical protein
VAGAHHDKPVAFTPTVVAVGPEGYFDGCGTPHLTVGLMPPAATK